MNVSSISFKGNEGILTKYSTDLPCFEWNVFLLQKVLEECCYLVRDTVWNVNYIFQIMVFLLFQCCLDANGGHFTTICDSFAFYTTKSNPAANFNATSLLLLKFRTKIWVQTRVRHSIFSTKYMDCDPSLLYKNCLL